MWFIAPASFITMILTNWLCPAGAARYTVNQAGVNWSYSCSKATVLWYEVDSVQRMDYKLSFFSYRTMGSWSWACPVGNYWKKQWHIALVCVTFSILTLVQDIFTICKVVKQTIYTFKPYFIHLFPRWYCFHMMTSSTITAQSCNFYFSSLRCLVVALS